MNIYQKNDLERSIQAAVHGGHFASLDEAMAKDAHLLLQELKQEPTLITAGAEPGLGSIGFMRDAADELNVIVADAIKRRREETWRDFDLE